MKKMMWIFFFLNFACASFGKTPIEELADLFPEDQRPTIISNWQAKKLIFRNQTLPVGFFEKLEPLAQNAQVLILRNCGVKSVRFLYEEGKWQELQSLDLAGNPKLNLIQRFFKSLTRLDVSNCGWTLFPKELCFTPMGGKNAHLIIYGNPFHPTMVSQDVQNANWICIDRQQILPPWIASHKGVYYVDEDNPPLFEK